MTSDKQLLATGPRQCASRTERRSQSDTAINVTTRVFPEAAGPPPELLLVHFLYRFRFPFLLLHDTKQSEENIIINLSLLGRPGQMKVKFQGRFGK